jgi:hypothetical protein
MNAGAYHLLSIDNANAPSGSDGSDWVRYRIAQGSNVITGYRRGSLSNVSEHIETVVSGLNERRLVRRGRVNLTAPHRPAGNTQPTD